MPKRSDLPTTFTPKFWELVDGRNAITKLIRRRFQTLREETGADSYQKELLCQRAIFLAMAHGGLRPERYSKNDG